jgi:hypothetical protein
MGRVACYWVLIVLIVLAAGSAVAQSAGDEKPADKFARWDSVEALQAGQVVEVRSEHQAGPDVCRVSSVDDSALTCVTENRAWPVRLVFPRAALRDVWLVELARDRHIGRWIRIGIETALFITACVAGGVVGGSVVGVLVMSLEAAIAENPIPLRYPSAPRVHRRLVYRTP